MRSCHFHPDRPGIGICMRCRAIICEACCTRLNGVNHCHACLKALGGRREDKRGLGVLSPIVAAVVLGMAWLLLLALCWVISGTMAP
ncbi:MAG: hypothetical protein ACRELF_29965 [Gemmataceae bacterium]